jgi:RHS repeat-associated protein
MKTAITCAALVLSTSGAAFAQSSFDQQVQPPTLNAPERGSLAGQLSHVAFGPADVSRGGFTLASALSAPEERGPVQAPIFPTYSPEAGISEWGLGWQANLAIVRWRASGDLDYATDEIATPWGHCHLGSDGFWYPAGLAARVRIQPTVDGFVAYLPDGAQWIFGGSAVVQNAAGTYVWNLRQIVSAIGRKTNLSWVANASGRLFLSQVDYGGIGDNPQARIAIGYELVSQPFVDLRSGAPLWLDRRVNAITISAKHLVTGVYLQRWSYSLSYAKDSYGPAFYLTAIQQTFASGDQPPGTTYDYQLAAEALQSASLQIVPAFDAVIAQYGADIALPTRSTAIDADLDGLVDLEAASDGALIHQRPDGFTVEPLPPAGATAPECRSAPSQFNLPRTLAQMRPSDASPQVVALVPDPASFQTNLTLCARDGTPSYFGTLPDVWQLGSNTRLVDLNRDFRPDLIQVYRNGYEVLPNVSSQTGYAFGAPVFGTLQLDFDPTATWVQDFNGDGIPDLLVRFDPWVVVYLGTGNYQFQPTGSVFAFQDPGAAAFDPTGYQFTFVDANNDGLADVLLSGSDGTVFVFVNTGTSFAFANVPALAGTALDVGLPMFLDLAGSGESSVFFTAGGSARSLALSSPGTGLLRTADDGRGTVVSFAYARANAALEARHRPSVLARMTVASSGYDAIAYDYSYSGPHLHSVGKFLLGFDRVVRADPNVTESADLLNDDRYSGVLLATNVHDAKAPDADAFSSNVYEEALAASVPFKRLRQETKGFRDASGATVSETTDYLAYALDVCPSDMRTALTAGTLTVTKTYLRPLAFANSLSCPAVDIVEQGAHSDPSLDFTHEVAITRNNVGLVTKVESVAPAGRWTLQDVAYDPGFLVTSAGAPGRGTSNFQYEPGTPLLRQAIAPTGVTAQASSRHPTTDHVLTLLTTRGPASWQQFFTYDGQERLASRLDDLGGATALNPNETYSYRYAMASTPASILVSTLVDAAASSVHNRVDLATAAGEAVSSVSRIPEGWAFGRLASRSRARSEEQGLLRGRAPTTADPTTMDFATLFTGATPVDFTGTSTLAKEIDERTTFHAGVERRVMVAQSIAAGVLSRTTTENGTISTTSRTDASRRVLTFDDEANVRYTYTYDVLGRVRQVLLPDGRKHTASYDGHGRPARIVREGIAIVDIAYDAISGLPTSKTFSSPAGQARRTVSWTYDAIGRIVREQHVDAVSGTSKSYVSYYDGATPANPMGAAAPGLLTAVIGEQYTKLLEYRVDGALTKRTVSLAGWRTVETTTGYVESGAVASRKVRLLDASGAQLAIHDWHYGFDSTGRAATTALNGAPLATFGYDANGLLTSAAFANGDSLTLSYDSLTRRTVGSTQATALTTASTTQRMNARGLVDEEDFQVGATTVGRQYSYSAQRFLVSAADAQHSYGYGFDSFGLPTSMAADGASTSIVQSGATLTAGTTVSQFDDLGRMVARGDSTFTYGPDGQLATAQTSGSSWSFVYDENGQRLAKLSGGVPKAAYVDEGFLDASGLAERISIGGRVVGLVTNAVYESVPTDLRGSVLAERDGTPRFASPFGKRDVRPAVASAIDYVQKGFDADLGLVRMGVRDYDSAFNRFTTPDPMFLEHPDLCLPRRVECNLYGYALNAPSTHVDPTGQSTWIDHVGNVQNVLNDGDLGIYQSLPPRVAGPPAKIGETYFWDSFTNGRGDPLGHVNVGKDITPAFLKIVDDWRGSNFIAVANQSRHDRSLDIKATWPGVAGAHKAQEGFMLLGKYVTLRDAGNMLYGINMANAGLNRDDMMRGAGGYQKDGMVGAIRGYGGKEYGPPPYYGEEDITGSRVDYGYQQIAPSLPDNRPPPEIPLLLP